MSKLRDRIRDTSRRRRGGLGFAPAPDDAPGGHILVVAEVADAASAAAAIEAGASALLAGDDAAAVAEAAGDAPAGVRLEDATAEQTKTAAEAGADFFLFDDARAAAGALLERRLGRVLLLEAGADEDRLRMLAPLRLDAVLLGAQAAAPTVRDQLALRRITELVQAPLMLAVTEAITAETLEVWRDSGAPAVLVPADGSALLAEVIAAASEVGPPRERDDDQRPDPLLPSITPTGDDEDDDFE
ncbi:MAG: hypothetical protein V3S31_05855 [Dehalococcoidia bacterium]